MSAQTGFALSSDSAVDPERGYLQFRRCEMRQHRRIATETAHRFRRDQDLVIVRGAETSNGRAVKDHPLRAERPRSAASPTDEDKGMIDTESLDRLEPAPSNLMVGQVQRNARIEIVGSNAVPSQSVKAPSLATAAQKPERRSGDSDPPMRIATEARSAMKVSVASEGGQPAD